MALTNIVTKLYINYTVIIYSFIIYIRTISRGADRNVDYGTQESSIFHSTFHGDQKIVFHNF